jgi:hypothetical protein
VIHLSYFVVLSVLSAASENQIDVDFVAQSGYDRSLFRSEVGLAGGKWETTRAGLRATLPTGPPTREPSKFLALVHLEGDFEIVVEYQVVKLPRLSAPHFVNAEEPSNNVEIAIRGKDFEATVFRDRRFNFGDEIGYYAKSPKAGVVMLHRPAKNKAIGQLGLRRVGEQLTFLHGIGDGPLAETGSTPLVTTPVTEVALQILALSSPDAIEVKFNRLHLTADRLIRIAPPLESTGLSKTTWIVIIHAVAIALGFAYWYSRAHRFQVRPQPAGKATGPSPRSGRPRRAGGASR